MLLGGDLGLRRSREQVAGSVAAHEESRDSRLENDRNLWIVGATRVAAGIHQPTRGSQARGDLRRIEAQASNPIGLQSQSAIGTKLHLSSRRFGLGQELANFLEEELRRVVED